MTARHELRAIARFKDLKADLDVRTVNCLWRNGYITRRMVATAPDAELLEMRNFGPSSLARLREAIPYQAPTWRDHRAASWAGWHEERRYKRLVRKLDRKERRA